MSLLRHRPNALSTRGQTGIALILALVFMLICSVIAIAAAGHASTQQRLTGSLRQALLADTLAETALRGAEWSLWTAGIDAVSAFACSDDGGKDACYRYDHGSPAYGPQGVVTRFRDEPGWVDTGTRVYKGPSDSIDYTQLSHGGRVARNPVFIIEDLGVEEPADTVGGPRESGAHGPGTTGPEHHARHIYRITARAVGTNENMLRVLESTYAAKAQ
jgi:type IV pilus assembly protein PilX